MADGIEPVVPQEVDLETQLKLSKVPIATAAKSLEARQKAMGERRMATPKLESLGAPTPLRAPSITGRKSPPTSPTIGEPLPTQGVTETSLPVLPPSIDRIVSAETGKKLKDALALGASPMAPDERDKIIAIAKSFNANPKFAQKVLDKLESGTFNEVQQNRVSVASRILEAAAESGDGDLSPGALTQFLDQALLQEKGIGANGEVRVDLNRNLKTGRLVIDVPNTLAKSLNSHLRKLVAEEGATYLRELPEDKRNKIEQRARDLAASDVISVALSARNLTMFDPGDVDVKELAQSQFRGVKAHLTRMRNKGGMYEAFAPTVDDLASEGPIDYFLRAQSPFDWMAPKMKLIREKLDAEGAQDLYGNMAALYSVAAFLPIANDWAMDQLGVTPEEEVRAYIDGWTWAEEGRVKQASLSALVADVTGGDAESVRKRSMESAGSLALPMAAYLFEPDAIFFATLGLGKGISAAKGVKASRPVVAAATLLRKVAKESDKGLAEAINELRKIDPVMADHAKIILTAKGGQKVGDIDDLVAQLGKFQDNAEAAEATLRQTLPTKDIDDLVDIARVSRENPETIEKLSAVVEKRAQVVGEARSMRESLDSELAELDKVIDSQKAAKIRLKETKKVTDREAAKMLTLMNKSEPVRNYVNAENILLRRQAQLKAASSTGNEAKIIELSEKVAKTKKEVSNLRKLLTAPEKEAVTSFRKTANRVGKNFRNAFDSYHGDDALKAMEATAKKLRSTSLRLRPVTAKAEAELTRATRRLVAADPKAARKFSKTLRTQGLTSGASALQESQRIVGDFVTAQKRLSDAVRANRWRQHALELADDYESAAKEIRKVGGTRGLLFTKTGPLGAKFDDALAIFSDAVRLDKAPEFSADFAALSVRETTEKSGRIVRIKNSLEGVPSSSSIWGRVSNETPDMFSAAKLEEGAEEPLRSEATLGNIQSMLHYAQRNGLGLDLSADGFGEMADLLRAAGLSLDSKGKIGAKALSVVDLGPLGARLNQLGSGVILDGAGVYEKMVSEFGEAAARFTLDKGGESAKLLGRSIEANAPIRITLAEAEKLQFELASILSKSAVVLDPARKHEKLAAILMDARSTHPTFRANWGFGMGKFANWIIDSARSYDPWFTRLGTASEDVANMVRGGENLTEVAWEEYQLILKEAGKGRDVVVQATYRYLDSTSRINVKGGRASVFNMGAKTIYQRAKRALLSDTPRHRYQHLTDAEQLAQANNPAILGLARMWIPGGVTVPEKAAGQLYGAAIKNLSKASTAEEFMSLQKSSTIQALREGAVPSATDPEKLVQKSLDGRIGRVHAFATRSFIVGAAYDEIATLAKRSTMGVMSAEEALDINRVLTGDFSNVADIDKTLDRLYAIGVSFLDGTTSSGKAGISALGEVNKYHKQIVKFADDASGEGIFAVNIARQGIDKAMGKYIKSLEAVEARVKDPSSRTAVKFAKKLGEWWRTSAVTGLIIPNLGRPVFDFYGDWTQMVFSNGIGFANRALFQNAWAGIPGLGPILQDRFSRLSKATKQPQLRSVVETMFNPHIEDFWQGRQGALRIGKNGPLVSYDFLRRRTIMDGIWDNQVSTDVLNLAEKLVEADPMFQRLSKTGATLDYIFDFGRGWQQGIERWIQVMQQRQRVGTYLIHVSDGKSFSEAARLTRNAIYDWKHGISQGELLYTLRAFPFIRWARLTSSQLLRGVLEGMSKPDLKSFAKAAVGQTAMNRLKVMYRAQRNVVPYMLDGRSPEEIYQEEGYINAVARGLYPKWVKTGMYPVLGVWNVDHGDMDRNARLYGDETKNTHWVGVGAPNGLIDMAMIYGNIAALMASTYLSARDEDLAAADLRAKSVEGITGMMYPAFRDLIELQTGLRQARGSGFGQPTPINPTEAEILGRMGAEISFNKERNQWYTTTTTANLLTKLPFVALNLSRVANDWKFRNPAAGEGLAEQMKYFALAQTRLLRLYPYNVFKEHERLQKVMSERAKIIEKKYKFE